MVHWYGKIGTIYTLQANFVEQLKARSLTASIIHAYQHLFVS